MTKKKKIEVFISPKVAANKIKKLLELNTDIGRRLSEVFDDWLALSVAALRMKPHHLLSLRMHGQIADDPQDIAELWALMRSIYGHGSNGYGVYFDRFKTALDILQHTSQIDWRDTLGELYMDVGSPNAGAGQFFTPFDLAKMMAMISCNGMIDVVYTRLREAIAETEGAAAFIMKHDLLATIAGESLWVWECLLPMIWPQFKPVTIYDPALGSGVNLIAAASTLPRWIVEYGLVQFYGQDIDATCVQMAQINLMLYGMNGYGLRCKLAAGDDICPPSSEVDWSALFGHAEKSVSTDGVKDIEAEDDMLAGLLGHLQRMFDSEPNLVEA